MKKIFDYLYIFSKFSTSFILLLLLLTIGYFFYVSFKNQELSNNDQIDLINKLNQNVEKLSKLSQKIQITEVSLDKIQQSIQNITNTESEEIGLLNKKIEEIDLNLRDISVNLQDIQTRYTSEPIKTHTDNSLSIINDKNKKEIVELIIYKFENNLDFTEELDLLQNFNDNNKQHIFEKINIIRLKNYRGEIFLNNIYAKELDFYLKEKFNKNFSNFILKSLTRFVAIQPSKTNIIKNNEINALNEITTLIEEKNYKMSYSKIIEIHNSEKYFSKTINQIQIVNQIKDLISKVK